jgi:glutathione S-transferase
MKARRMRIEPLSRSGAALGGERLSSTISIGEVAVAAALGYVDLRFPEHGWRTEHKELASWFEDFARRESFLLTRP